MFFCTKARGKDPQELEREMASVLEEHAQSTSMSILAALEAAYREDQALSQICSRFEKLEQSLLIGTYPPNPPSCEEGGTVSGFARGLMRDI